MSALHQRINRWHDPLRMHMGWISTLTGLATITCLVVDVVVAGVPSRWWAAAFASATIFPNVALGVLFSRFPKVDPVNMCGLTMMNKWLEEHGELVAPVAGWLEACEDLDTRHFICLRRHVEGHARLPGPVGGQWVVRNAANGTLCRNAHDMLDGKMREHVMLARNERGYRKIAENTPSVSRPSHPRRL